MGTRSRIGIMKKDGSITSIYCHWDGYLEHNGVLLALHYNSTEKAEKLVALGDISYLGHTLCTTEDYFNMRDEPIQIKYNANEEDFLKHAFDSWEEYAYLYKDDEWYYCEDEFGSKSEERKLEKLTPALIERGMI